MGKEKTQNELIALLPDRARLLWQFVQPQGNSTQALQYLQAQFEEQGVHTSALDDLKQIFEQLNALDLGDFYLFDPCITRGLDYYTGIVFETFLEDMSEIGSVCSGGRYDNLVGLYSNEEISGIGGSVGLDRLLTALEEKQGALPQVSGADVVLIYAQDMLSLRRLQLALQAQGIKTACFPDEKKLDQQFRYAQSLGARLGVFYKEKEGFILRNLASRENIPAADVETAILHIRKILYG